MSPLSFEWILRIERPTPGHPFLCLPSGLAFSSFRSFVRLTLRGFSGLCTVSSFSTMDRILLWKSNTPGPGRRLIFGLIT